MTIEMQPKNPSPASSQRGESFKKPTSPGFVRGNRGTMGDVAARRSSVMDKDVEEFYANVPCTD